MFTCTTTSQYMTAHWVCDVVKNLWILAQEIILFSWSNCKVEMLCLISTNSGVEGCSALQREISLEVSGNLCAWFVRCVLLNQEAVRLESVFHLMALWRLCNLNRRSHLVSSATGDTTLVTPPIIVPLVRCCSSRDSKSALDQDSEMQLHQAAAMSAGHYFCLPLYRVSCLVEISNKHDLVVCCGSPTRGLGL